MPVDVTSRSLPGIGVCQEIALHTGRRLGIVTRRNGQRDLIVYDDEGDGAAETVTMSRDEANAIAELLGAPHVVFQLSVLQKQAEGLLVEQLPLPAGSPFVDRPFGEAQIRTRTGVSVVAVLRLGAAIPSPTPDFVLEAGDQVVAVGTREALDEVARIFAGPAVEPTGSTE